MLKLDGNWKHIFQRLLTFMKKYHAKLKWPLLSLSHANASLHDNFFSWQLYYNFLRSSPISSNSFFACVYYSAKVHNTFYSWPIAFYLPQVLYFVCTPLSYHVNLIVKISVPSWQKYYHQTDLIMIYLIYLLLKNWFEKLEQHLSVLSVMERCCGKAYAKRGDKTPLRLKGFKIILFLHKTEG